MEPTEPEDVPIGTMFEGKYRIEGVLGSGGMGRVYEATHTLLNKRVALKMLLPQYATEQRMVARMIREARAASATGHPNIASVTDMGWAQERPFIVMELLRGETLAARIKRGRVPLRQALGWTSKILEGLSAVHDSGVIHRDLKPENVMVVPAHDGSQSIKILDFGISKLVLEDGGISAQQHTKTGRVLGTPHYMAPEQARALSDIDARVDLHAAGAVLYAMLCGEPPFRGKTIAATLVRLMDGEFTPISERVAGVPTSLDAVLAKALAADRAQRYPSADAMRKALARLEAPSDTETLADGSSLGPPPVEVEKVSTKAFEALNAPQLAPLSVTEVADGPAASYPNAPAAASGATELQLDVPQGWKPGFEADVPSAKPVRAGGPNWLWIAMIVVFVGLAIGAWTQWDRVVAMTSSETSTNEEREMILLLVDTMPPAAIVFIDDVQHNERPIELPRSTEHVKLRVEAQGYQSHVIQIKPTTTRRIKVDLKKR